MALVKFYTFIFEDQFSVRWKCLPSNQNSSREAKKKPNSVTRHFNLEKFKIISIYLYPLYQLKLLSPLTFLINDIGHQYGRI